MKKNSALQIKDCVNFSSGLIGKKGQNSIQNPEPKEGYSLGITSGSEFGRYWIICRGNYLSTIPNEIKSGLSSVDYKVPKLFLRQTGDSIITHLDEKGLLALNNAHIGNFLIPNLVCKKFILALLNSKLYTRIYQILSLEKGRAMAQIDIDFLELLPIIKIPPSDQEPLINLVNQILAITYSSSYDPHNPPARQKELEAEIDIKVYGLYGLTKEEIRVIEENIDK